MRTKKLFFSVLALAGMLFANSCTQEDVVGGASGDFVSATFTLSTADGLATRAIGDGTTVDEVACAVYDANGNELKDLRQYVKVEGKTATYSIRLAKGLNYRVAFFAYNKAAAAYNVTDLKNIVVNPGQLSNLESRDAFTGYYDVKKGETMNTITTTVDLCRPFAQLNLGIDATELKAAADAGAVVKKSYIKVSNVYNAFSAYDNAVVATDTAEEMEFAMNTIPAEALTVGEATYTYLAMNYLLVGDEDAEKSLTDVTFVWEDENGVKNDPAISFINIPVQRNYRTNITGRLLTSPADFTITIDAAFKGDKPVNEIGTMYYTVSTLEELQSALDAATTNSKTVIQLAAKIEGDVIVAEKQNASIFIDGCGKEYDGQFRIHGYSDDQNATTIFKNINFRPSTAKYSIYGDEDKNNATVTRYIDNVIIENCTFTAANGTEAYQEAAAIYFKAAKSVEMMNCTATNMHSIFLTESGRGNAVVDNVKTINCKNSVSFNNTPKAVISNSTLQSVGTDGYGVRVKGENPGYGITVKNCDINAVVPVLVRNMTANGFDIAFEGENVFTTTNYYQVVISKTDYSIDEKTGKWLLLAEPTGTYNLTGADNFVVYPETCVASPANSFAQFDEFVKAGVASIILTGDIATDKIYNLNKTLDIDLNGHKMIMSNPALYYQTSSAVTITNGVIEGKLYAEKGALTLSDVTFSGDVVGNSITGNLYIKSGNVLATNCSFKSSSSTSAEMRPLTIASGATGSFKFVGCEFKIGAKQQRIYVNPFGNPTTTLEFTDCILPSQASTIDLPTGYPLENLTISNIKGGITLGLYDRTKESLQTEYKDILDSYKSNMNGSSLRIFYNGGSMYW